jgi:hypothetical protein
VNSTPAYRRTPSSRAPRIFFISKVAFGFLDIFVQFEPNAWCAGVTFVGCLLEAFKFSSRHERARYKAEKSIN